MIEEAGEVTLNANSVLDAALKNIGLPVSRIFRDTTDSGKPAPDVYLTYQLIFGENSLLADDGDEGMQSVWRVYLYSRINYMDIVKKVVRALKKAGFYGVTLEAEQYERDTGYYHISFSARYLEAEDYDGDN